MTAAPISPADARTLTAAVTALEHPGFAARLADYAGRPLDGAIRLLPGVISRPLRASVQAAIMGCLRIAVESLEEDAALPPSPLTAKVVTGVTGAVGGFFGPVALPFELPLTTTLMLRSIAEIARSAGEDLGTVPARLACIEVFAFGQREGGRGADGERELTLDYPVVRSILSKLTADVAAYVTERGAINASAPIIARLVGEVVSRFGLVVSDRLTAGGWVPVIGSVGGATVNVVFMDHFQRLARAHFAVRALERRYGVEPINAAYRALAPPRASRAPRLRSWRPRLVAR